ncbi:MAG: hypothetical protein GY898_26285 [Proteobacteria bacterium]|nr:hypothetical protein [Pseudomonadota bacterium]
MRDRISLILLALASTAVVCGPLVLGAWIGGHEGTNYLYRTAEFSSQMSQGEPWPRWAPDFYWGYGYPFFVFYPPLVFWISGLLTAVAGVAGALKLTMAVGCLSTFFGTRYLLQPYCGEHSARLAGAVATVFQWHFVQVYIRGDLAEAFATSLLPWVFAAVLRDKPLRLALGLGAMALCHTLTAVMACWCVAVLGLAKLHARDLPGFARTAGGGIAGLLLAAGYLLPAWVERPFVSTERMIEKVEGVFTFHWGDHFVGPLQRFDPGYQWGTSVSGWNDGMPLGNAPMAWVIVAACVVLAVREPEVRARLAPWLAAFVALEAMATPVSTPLWAVLPLADFFQFPWRWLLVEGIVVGGLAALLAAEIEARGLLSFAKGVGALALLGMGVQAAQIDVSAAGAYGYAAIGIVNLLVLGSLLVDFESEGGPIARVGSVVVVAAALPLMLGTFHKAAADPTPVTEIQVASFEDPTLLQRMDLIDASGNLYPIITDGVDAYLPDTVEEAPKGPPGSDRGPRPSYDLGPPAEQHGAWRRWYVDQPTAGMREAIWFMYPGTLASVDGAEVPITHDETGLVQIEVPAGPHVVDVWYAGTGTQRLGQGISAATLLVLGGLALWGRRRDAYSTWRCCTARREAQSPH